MQIQKHPCNRGSPLTLRDIEKWQVSRQNIKLNIKCLKGIEMDKEICHVYRGVNILNVRTFSNVINNVARKSPC